MSKYCEIINTYNKWNLKKRSQFIELLCTCFGMNDATLIVQDRVGSDKVIARDCLTKHFHSEHIGYDFYKSKQTINLHNYLDLLSSKIPKSTYPLFLCQDLDV